uniref:ABC transmembrane type-1 domain-containing protein n=1 Tax=Globodera pallida TaxID=36090 RepID=A0A183C432_GLOPA
MNTNNTTTNNNNIIGNAKKKNGAGDKPTLTGETEVFIQAKPTNVKSACSRVDDVSWLSFISFAWMFPWMWRAFRGQLGQIDTATQWTCSIFDSANVNMTRLEHLWNEEIKKCLRPRPAALTFPCRAALYPISTDDDLLVRNDDGTPMYSYGFYMAISILMVEMLRVLAYGATWAVSYRTAIRARGALLALLFKRLMHAKSLRHKTPAEVVNHFANDGQRIFDALTFAPLVLVGPSVLMGGLVYLLSVIGPLSLLGVAVFFIFDIIQGVLGVTMVKCRNRAIAHTERRMALVGELIRCIKCIKLNGWEQLFEDRVREIYMEYIRAGGGPLLCALVIASFILNVGANIFGTVWLSNWMRVAHNNGTEGGGSLADTPSFYINIYACTLLVLFISGVIKALLFVKVQSIRIKR